MFFHENFAQKSIFLLPKIFSHQVNYMTAPSVRANYVSMVPYNRLKNAHGKGNAVYGVEWSESKKLLKYQLWDTHSDQKIITVLVQKY